MNVYEMAKTYYPRLWSKKRLAALVAAGKLTEDEYTEIAGEEESVEIADAETVGGETE